jgi:hypothetical protein
LVGWIILFCDLKVDCTDFWSSEQLVGSVTV